MFYMFNLKSTIIMKKYIFIIRLACYHSPRIYMDFECDADAMKCARETLTDWKKQDATAQIDVFQARRFGDSWISDRWVVSYN